MALIENTGLIFSGDAIRVDDATAQRAELAAQAAESAASDAGSFVQEVQDSADRAEDAANDAEQIITAVVGNNPVYYATIAEGMAAASVGDTFGVAPGGADGLTNLTIFRKTSSVFYQEVVQIVGWTQVRNSASLGEIFSLVTEGGSTSTSYTASVRMAQSGLVVGNNTQLAFAPNTTSGTNPNLTVAGVTRSIKDVTGADLAMGALVAGQLYILRVYSSTEVRLVSLVSAADAQFVRTVPAALSLGAAISLVTDTGSSTGANYVASVRAAHASIAIQTNTTLDFAPNVSNLENPSLTVGGVTRSIKDMNGANLPAGYLVAGSVWNLRVYSATELRIFGQAMLASTAANLTSLGNGYRIRNSAASEAFPGVNPIFFSRSFIGTPDTAPPMDFPIVDLGESGGRVVQFTNNTLALRDRLPIEAGQRYRFRIMYRVTENTPGTADNIRILIRGVNYNFTGIATSVAQSRLVSVSDGWQIADIDTGNFVFNAAVRLIAPVIQHQNGGAVQVQFIDWEQISAGGGSSEVWEPPIRPVQVMQHHTDYPTYRNWVTPPYAPVVLTGTTGMYTYAWPHPKITILASNGRRIDLSLMIRGTTMRYICQSGIGGLFAGYGGRTFHGQGANNYATIPAGTIVEVGFDATTTFQSLTVTHISGPAITFSTIADPIADKSILYAGQSLAAQAYQMGGPGGFYHAMQSGEGGVTPIRDITRFIQGAEGGTTIDMRGNTTRYWWDYLTDSPGPVLLDCISSVNAVVADGQPIPTSVLWNQGQSDATYINAGTYSANDYKSQLAKVLDYLQANALGGVGKIVFTTISRADRTGQTFGANAVRVAQLETISERVDCWQGAEEYDLSGEGGLDVHLSPKGYFTSGYRAFRQWHNAMFGTSVTAGPVAGAVTKISNTSVRVALSGVGAGRMPVGRGNTVAGGNFDFGPTPFLWGAIDAAGQQIPLRRGSISGNNLTIESDVSLVGARLIFPCGYANGWREALHPTDSNGHIDYDGLPLRSFLSGIIP